jgi:aminopeptidase N
MLGPLTEGDITTHEVGHMWFYSLVGNDQGRDPWLDEGLTTWAEARYQQTLPVYEAQPLARAAQGHLGESMSYWTLRPSAYQDGVYVQGAQALAALGPPELVDCALRVYVAQNAYRIATPADLVAAATSVFPDAAGKLAGFGVTP